MARIPVEQAEAGMVLAESVTDRRGRLLIPGGKELSERYLSALPMWGITHIEVEGEAPGGEEDLLESVEPWALARATTETDDLFLHANRSHPAMAHLYHFRVRRRAREIQKGGEHAG